MFYVDKNEITTHWWACAGTVKEGTGEGCAINNDFEKFEDAHSFAYLKERKKREDAYENLKNRFLSIELLIYSIRSFWSSRVREDLKKYDQKLQKAKEAAEGWIDVRVHELPEKIPVLGDRIALGTRVYSIYTDTLTLVEDVVVSESINYYDFHPNGVEATYRLAKKGSINSTLKSGYSNVEVYFDKEEAKARILALCLEKQAEIEEKIKAL